MKTTRGGKAAAIAKRVTPVAMLAFQADNMATYGRQVVEERALTDYRDGLKPVQRRVLWAMHQLGLRHGSGRLKSSRVIGDVIGKYHPHADSSPYESMVLLAPPNRLTPMVDGQGNFGTPPSDPPASMRYTEVRLSKIADLLLFNPDYLAVTPMVENYDGRDTEPLYLPALVPLSLVLGTRGIAVGVNALIPPFSLASVLTAAKAAVRRGDGRKLTAAYLAKTLKVAYPYGGVVLSSISQLTSVFENGVGPIVVGPEYVVHASQRKMVITGLPPYFETDSAQNVLEKKMNNVFSSIEEHCKNVTGSAPIIDITITFKRVLAVDSVQGAAEKVADLLKETLSVRTNYTKRTLHRDERGDLKHEFCGGTIVQLLNDWTTYRIDLEKRCQLHRISVMKGVIARQKLAIFIAQNVDRIVKAVRSEDPEGNLRKWFALEDWQIKIIRETQLRQLERTSEAAAAALIVKTRAGIVEARGWFARPAEKIEADLTRFAEVLAAKPKSPKDRRPA